MHCVVGLATVSMAALGCSVTNDPADAERQPTQTEVGKSTSSASSGTDLRWACSPGRRVEFFTYPTVYERGVPLRRLASRVVDHASFEIQRDGLKATVTFLNRQHLIQHRFEYIRGATWGWSLERGERCRGAR